MTEQTEQVDAEGNDPCIVDTSHLSRRKPAPPSDDLLVEARDLLQAEWDNGAKYQPKAEEFARVITKLNERLGVSDEKP